jgi:uncharacterized ion transporter superfamily protein YfcC
MSSAPDNQPAGTTSTALSQRLPDTYLLIAAVGLLVFLAGYLVAPGQFDVQEVVGADGRVQRMVDPASFRHAGEPRGAPLFSAGDTGPGLFNAVYEGLVSGSRDGGAVGIIAFILLTGGAFGIVMATGSVDRALRRLISDGTRDARVMLAVLFVTFSLGGAVFGMGEEAIPFVLLLMPVLARLGYDNATAVLVTYAATQVGFATSWMNPFSVAIAQGIAGLPLLSGMGLRIGMWAVLTLFGVLFLLRYAGRHRVPPARPDAAEGGAPPLGAGDWLVLAALALTVAWIVWGVVAAGYYLPEIATQFVVLGFACAAAGCLFRLDGMTANGAVAAFRAGAQALLPAALVIGFARGIVYLMGGDDPTEPSLLNTLLHAGSESLGGLPAWLASWLMLLGQSVFNFFVTSGSGQAALTMPIMAPLSDLLGVTRQVAVLAFQLGDGLTNILVPTSAALMGCLGAARLEWSRWMRVAAPFGAGLLLLASVFVVGAVLAGFR